MSKMSQGGSKNNLHAVQEEDFEDTTRMEEPSVELKAHK